MPRPEANVDLRDDGGAFVARPDLMYRDPPVVIQYDGGYHFRDLRQRRLDAARDEKVRDLGYEVRLVTALDRAAPADVVARVHRARELAAGRVARGFVVDTWPERVAIARGAAAERGA